MTSRKELEKAIAKIASFGGYITTDNKEAFSAVLDAAREHLKVLPHSEFIEVWHVEYVNDSGRPCVNVIARYEDNRAVAVDEMDRLRRLNCKCINMTGPHQHEVPA